MWNSTLITVPISFILLVLTIFPTCYSGNLNRTASFQSLCIGENGTYSINSTTEYIIDICNITSNVDLNPPRVYVTCDLCTSDYPVLVVVREKRGILSWELPFNSKFKNESFYDNTTQRNVARTMCPADIRDINEKNDVAISVSLSTFSRENRTVQLTVSTEQDFVLKSDGKLLNKTLTPVTPMFFAYYWSSKNETSILLQVESPNETCMDVSVQHIHCPVYDLEENVQFDGFWQIVTTRSALTVTKDKFPKGFFVVLVLRGDDEQCSQRFVDTMPLLMKLGEETRSKMVSISVMEAVSDRDYLLYTTLTLGAFGLLALLSIPVSYFYTKKVQKVYQKIYENARTERAEPSAINAILQSVNETSNQISSPESERVDTISCHTDSSLDEIDVDTLNEIENDKNFIRSKVILTVYDMSRKKPSILERKSRLYLWYLLTVAIFYFLPVVQLVITYQMVIQTTGNQNLCYYNFLCAHPLGLLPDFNHVFSNVGYLFLGILFIVLTARRQSAHIQAVRSNRFIKKHFGIPQHYGLFYAMGASLFIVGVLSACYHVCPNAYNFQFDTSFMYVISTICMMKIYHSRHADVSASATATFAVLAFAILLGMCGVLYGTPSFWSIFTLIHLSMCAWLSLQIYYIDFRTKNLTIGNLKRHTQEILVNLRIRNYRIMLPTYPARFFMICLMNFVNWGLAIAGPKYKAGDFAGYLLVIFMSNLILYLLFYIFMKLVNKEKINRLTCLFLILSVCWWSPSLYFFLNKLVSWQLTPAASKELNQPCLGGFYDNHDWWHFTSAFSMFTSFMVLLTLDDDVIDVPREQLAVF